MNQPIKVLVIDDSRSIQKMLELQLSKYDDIEVIGGAYDPYEAVKIMRNVKPDVIILDVKMPGMDGLTFLKKLMEQHPIPVIVHSALITKNPQIGIRALEYGAVEVVDKPVIDFTSLTTSMVQEDKLLRVVRQIGKIGTGRNRVYSVKQNRYTSIPKFVGGTTFNHIVCLGASAGGTQAIKYVLSQLPHNFPPILIVQHMPVEFTGQFARHLNNTSQMFVDEAKDREPLLNGKVYIAPGDRHLTLKQSGSRLHICLEDGVPVSGHKPSVDVLFKSATKVRNVDIIGVLLTGMGKDGAEGMLKMKEAGCYTIAQDEASSIVYGMPQKAKALGAVMHEYGLTDIPNELLNLVSKK